MEQHLYTWLNQRYGLRALIIEHASAIIRATNKFAEADSDVAVFLRILRYSFALAVARVHARACACAVCVHAHARTRLCVYM
jgi:hypothetical protein